MPEQERMNVAIGLITDGDVRVELDISTWTAWTDGEWTARIVQPSGPYLDMGRNKVVRRFLNYPKFLDDDGILYDQEWLYFCDSDVPIRRHAIRDLVNASNVLHDELGVYPIIGGVYLGIDEGIIHPITYRWNTESVELKENEEGRIWAPVPPGQETDGQPKHWILRPLDKDELKGIDYPIEVDAFGTGSMLIHRSTLEDMAKVWHEPLPWFITGPVPVPDTDGLNRWMGEDIQFCLRAKVMGHPIYTHAGVKLTHYKTVGLSFDHDLVV